MTVFGGLTTINIPPPPGPNVYIGVSGIDAAGEIVGYYGYVDGSGDQYFQGFVDSGGVVSPFGPPTSSNNLSIGITASGEIFGTYINNENERLGFTYNNGTFTNIDDGFLSISTTVDGVNGTEVYGTYEDLTDVIHGFIENSGVFTTIDIPGYGDASISGIDAAGEIVGNVVNSAGTTVGFTDNAGNITTIDIPGSTGTSVSVTLAVRSSVLIGTLPVAKMASLSITASPPRLGFPAPRPR